MAQGFGGLNLDGAVGADFIVGRIGDEVRLGCIGRRVERGHLLLGIGRRLRCLALCCLPGWRGVLRCGFERRHRHPFIRRGA